MEDFERHCPAGTRLGEQMRELTGTRFFDWIDAIGLPDSPEMRRQLEENGYKAELSNEDAPVFRNAEGVFPRIVLRGERAVEVVLKVDSVADFLAANQIEAAVEGAPFAPLRRAVIAKTGSAVLSVAERRGAWRWTAEARDVEKSLCAAEHFEEFRRRKRRLEEEADGFNHAAEMIRAAIGELGVDQTCSLFFAAEREFWQRRNQAAQVQKHRAGFAGAGLGES